MRSSEYFSLTLSGSISILYCILSMVEVYNEFLVSFYNGVIEKSKDHRTEEKIALLRKTIVYCVLVKYMYMKDHC